MVVLGIAGPGTGYAYRRPCLRICVGADRGLGLNGAKRQEINIIFQEQGGNQWEVREERT